MRIFLILFLVFYNIDLVFPRVRGVQRDNICESADPETLTILDDVESCGGYILCMGEIAKRFKCFTDSVYGDGSSICLSCEENQDEYYDDGSDDKYGNKRPTKKKFTFKQTKKDKNHSRKYGKPTKPPRTKPYPTSNFNSIKKKNVYFIK
jgi:hypothetical protein